MKTPSASKHRLAGRNLPKLDRYNGYSHQNQESEGPAPADRSELCNVSIYDFD